MKDLDKTVQKNTHGGYRRGSGRGKKGWYKGFFCDSTYELAFVIYSLDHNQKFKRCTRTYNYFFENSWHVYHPDFELADGSLIEIKGYHTKKVDVKILAVTDRPLKVLYRKDLNYCFNYILDTYGYTDSTIFLMYENSLDLTELYLLIIDSILQGDLKFSEIAKKYNVSKQLVSKINTGKIAFNKDLSYPIYRYSKSMNKLNKKQNRKLNFNFCKNCGKTISKNASYCADCYNSLFNTSILNRLDKSIILLDLFLTSLSSVGKKYGISANAVIKWLKSNNLPSHIKDLKIWYSENILHTPTNKNSKPNSVKKSILPVAMCDLVSNAIIKKFNSAIEASIFLGKSTKEAGNIIRVCNKTRKSAYGYHWCFI